MAYMVGEKSAGEARGRFRSAFLGPCVSELLGIGYLDVAATSRLWQSYMFDICYTDASENDKDIILACTFQLGLSPPVD
jgi:hypothetical protein